MIPGVTPHDLIHQTRNALLGFWDEHLKVEETRNGLVLALPLMLPDGLQVIVHYKSLTPTAGILTDNGEILGRLASLGLRIETAQSKLHDLLEERLAFFEMRRDGLELQRPAALPLNPLDIELFTEGLVSIAHLAYRHDLEVAEENIADRKVTQIFSGRNLFPQRHAVLVGNVAKKIKVDYFLPGQRGLALEVISRKSDLHAYMEQWGFRWGDLHAHQPALVRAMIYDPERQNWDALSLELGKHICDYFCPYHETDRIAEAIEHGLHR